MINLYTELDRQLAAGKKTVLARIIRQVGSAPRTVGTKLIICEDGSIQGTIGGGSLEYQVIAKSKTIFREGRSEIFHFRMTGEELAASQMLCGGIVDIFLEPIFPQNEMLRELMHHICILISEGRKGVLITRVSEGVEFNDAKCRVLVLDDGKTVGDLPGKYRPGKDLIQQWQEFNKPALLGSEQEGDAGMVFVEPIESEAVLFLFGAGHISTFVAPLAKMVGFRVAVIDDRQDFLNAERFAHADELIVSPFTEAFESLTINGTSYIAVITR
jgi:xanthine dehydrogenase accessory factor